jgi:superfamily II DNA or RNA helicase
VSCFPAIFEFQGTWRPYQQRVLQAFDHHLADGHFHIAAAPGAGKTVLGLEALRRLGRPTLVLAPTSAIRDQWLLRLCEGFLGCASPPPWCSSSLETPGLLTVGTYQALHAAAKRSGTAALVEGLRQHRIGTLVLDEAHHLRQAWWRCLQEVKAGLGEPWLVALTATPPFDVPQAEWNRYIGLCGPIDAEVTAPELVRAGNLCPHQDYIYFSHPSAAESALLDRFDHEVGKLLAELVIDRELVTRVAELELVTRPQSALAGLLERSDFALALAIFLHTAAAEHARKLVHALGLSEAALPGFDRGWAELLVNGLLFDRSWGLPEGDLTARALRTRLQAIGAIRLRQAYLQAPPQLLRLLEASTRKCASVAAIIELESGAHPQGLRALVLCDRILEAFFVDAAHSEPDGAALGVVPIFDALRRLRLPHVRLGILTGSLVVLPLQALQLLISACEEYGRTECLHEAEPLPHAPEFVRLHPSANESSALLLAITRLFERGELNVLVGTAALLGEGWDCPALNTLVLATEVRSAMASNQMRGRAIRLQPGFADKTANIWHLACLRPDAEHPGGADLKRLAQRFLAFAAVAHGDTVIENGIERMGLDAAAVAALDCDALNARMSSRALDRFGMARAWRTVLKNDSKTPKRLVHETRVRPHRIAPAARFLHRLAFERLPLLRWWRSLQLRRHLLRVAAALLEALRARALVRSPAASVDVQVESRWVRCRLRHVESAEETVFAECLRQFFDFPESPRYLLIQGDVSFAVPNVLGGRRDSAELLQRALGIRLGTFRLVYTLDENGRRALLRARECWLAGRFSGGCESRQVWG